MHFPKARLFPRVPPRRNSIPQSQAVENEVKIMISKDEVKHIAGLARIGIDEKELGKFDYSDFSLVFSIIKRENFSASTKVSASTNAYGWSYDNLTPEQKADYDFMMHM